MIILCIYSYYFVFLYKIKSVDRFCNPDIAKTALFARFYIIYNRYEKQMQRNTQTNDHCTGVCSQCARSDKQLINTQTQTQNYGGSSALYRLCPSLPDYMPNKQFKAISGLITTVL